MKIIPKVDDRIAAFGHPGVFVVSRIDARHCTAEITSVTSPHRVLRVDWEHVEMLDIGPSLTEDRQRKPRSVKRMG